MLIVPAGALFFLAKKGVGLVLGEGLINNRLKPVIESCGPPFVRPKHDVFCRTREASHPNSSQIKKPPL